MSKRSATGMLAVQAAARSYRVGSAGAKFTLVVLIEQMGNYEGEWRCFPGTDLLAEQTEQSEGSVRRHLAELQRQGLITKRVRALPGGGRDTTEWVLNLDVLNEGANAQIRILEGAPEDEPTRSQRAANARIPSSAPITRTVVTVGTGKEPCADAACEPSADAINSTPSAPDRSSPDYGFGRFWEAYPLRNGKRVGRAKTEAKWRTFSYETKQRIWIATKHYADAIRAGVTLAKDPERFLANRCWEDWEDGPGSVTSNAPKRDGYTRTKSERQADAMQALHDEFSAQEAL